MALFSFSAFQCCLCAVFFHPLLWNIFSPGLAKRGRGDVMSSLPLCTARSDFDGVAVPSAQREKGPPLQYQQNTPVLFWVLGLLHVSLAPKLNCSSIVRYSFATYLQNTRPSLPCCSLLLRPGSHAHTHHDMQTHEHAYCICGGSFFRSTPLSFSVVLPLVIVGACSGSVRPWPQKQHTYITAYMHRAFPAKYCMHVCYRQALQNKHVQ